MEIKELTALQQKAISVYTKFHHVNFGSGEEVLNFLHELHPYMTDVNVNLPKEQLFHLLQRHGYGDSSVGKGRTYQMITNLMIDMEINEILNLTNLRNSNGLNRFQIVH